MNINLVYYLKHQIHHSQGILWSMQHISTSTLATIHRPQSSLKVQEITGCHILAQEVPDLLYGGHGSKVDLQGGRGASHIQRDGERWELAISMLGDLHMEAIPKGWDVSVWTHSPG